MNNKNKNVLRNRLTAFAILALSLAGQSQRHVLYTTPQPAGFASSKIAKADLAADMEWWQTVMEESHVNPYHAISKTALKELQTNILSKLSDSVSHAQACFAVSELVGALNEGHLGFVTNRVSDSLYAYLAVRFPYLLENVNERAFVVRRDLSAENRLPAGSRIMSVNGVTVDELYRRYEKFNGGLDAWKKRMVRNNVRRLLYMDGLVSPFAVTAVSGKDTLCFSVEGYSWQQTDSIGKVVAAAFSQPEPFAFRLTADNVAVIDFNTMDGPLQDSFAVFLKKTFEEIAAKKAKGVVVDMRRNGGGNSWLGEMLLSYISSKPYRMAGGVKMRISQHSKAIAALRKEEGPIAKQENGTLYEKKIDKLTTPEKNALRFQGPVAVLVGTGTFSSANMLANAIRDYDLATLIGEQTAEPGNDFGEIFSFMLPRTRIVASGATKMFTRANGDETDFGGIKPHIEVKASSIAGEDAVLAAALAWVKKQRRV